MTIFGIFNELLSTQTVNATRFATQCWMRVFLWFSNTVKYWKGQRAVYCWNWLQPWMKLLNQSYFSDFYRTTKTCWDSLIKIQLSHNSHNCIFMRVGEFLPTQDQVEFDMPSLKNEWMSCFIYTNGLNAVCNHPWLHQHKKNVFSV